MNKNLYRNDKIRWFVSVYNNNHKLDAIVVPFIVNNSSTKVKNILTGEVFDFADSSTIAKSLNSKYNRLDFELKHSFTSAVIEVINSSSFVRSFFHYNEDIDWRKEYYSLNNILSIAKQYKKAIERIEKNKIKIEKIEENDKNSRDF